MPVFSSSAKGVLERLGDEHDAARGGQHRDGIHQRRDSAAARVSGPMNSIVTATPIGRCAREP